MHLESSKESVAQIERCPPRDLNGGEVVRTRFSYRSADIAPLSSERIQMGRSRLIIELSQNYWTRSMAAAERARECSGRREE